MTDGNQVSANVPDELKQKVVKISDTYGLTQSQVVRACIAFGTDKISNEGIGIVFDHLAGAGEVAIDCGGENGNGSDSGDEP